MGQSNNEGVLDTNVKYKTLREVFMLIIHFEDVNRSWISITYTMNTLRVDIEKQFKSTKTFVFPNALASSRRNKKFFVASNTDFYTLSAAATESILKSRE